MHPGPQTLLQQHGTGHPTTTRNRPSDNSTKLAIISIKSSSKQLISSIVPSQSTPNAPTPREVSENPVCAPVYKLNCDAFFVHWYCRQSSMNIPQTPVTRKSKSLQLQELVTELFDADDTSNQKRQAEVELISSYIALFDIPLQLVVTGSSIERTNLDHRIKGSDVDVMLIPQCVRINQLSLVYNKRFPCFALVDLRLGDNLSGMVNGEYLHTNFLKEMKFLKGGFLENLKQLFTYGLFTSNRLGILSDSAVGMKFETLQTPVTKSSPELLRNLTSDLQNFEDTNIGEVIANLNESLSNGKSISNFYKTVEKAFKGKSPALSTKQREESITKTCLEDDMVAHTSSNCTKPDEEYRNTNQMSVSFQKKGSTDIVPALVVEGWPAPASEWITRQRNWPDRKVVEEIIHQGVHLVAKPLPLDPDEEHDFRVSFSLAEIKLAKAMNETQRSTISILKACNKYAGSEYLISYHIKTSLYWMSENKSVSFWSLDNLSTCVESVLGFLLTSVRRQFLPHYFIREMNLFAGFNYHSFCDMEDRLLTIYHEVPSFVIGYIEESHDESVTVSDTVEGEQVKFFKTNSPDTCRSSIKDMYKQLLLSLTDQVLTSSAVQVPEKETRERFMNCLDCRSRLERLDGVHDFDDVIFRIAEKMKDKPSSEVLLKSVIESFATHYKHRIDKSEQTL
ncbi:hypothetical protein ScPMuIL_002277 [Solemya velum]